MKLKQTLEGTNSSLIIGFFCFNIFMFICSLICLCKASTKIIDVSIFLRYYFTYITFIHCNELTSLKCVHPNVRVLHSLICYSEINFLTFENLECLMPIVVQRYIIKFWLTFYNSDIYNM